MKLRKIMWIGMAIVGIAGYLRAESYDILIRNGSLYDGSGAAPTRGDVAIRGQEIVAIGEIPGATGKSEIDASGLAVAPGFINMLSWATESLIQDGRSMGDIRQGVTLEVFGEGVSMGPLNEKLRESSKRRQGDIKYEIEWTTLDEYLRYLVKKGVSPNVASFVGATTVRSYVVGLEDREPTPEELEQMRALVRQAMEEGALGVGSSLIYPPAFYAKTKELIEICKVAGEYGGMYISHMRSEGSRLLEGIDELITISREAGLPAEIYHLKMGGKAYWNQYEPAIKKIEAARAEGLRITTNMYTYTAGSTGLAASVPPWLASGGTSALIKRLKDPKTRENLESVVGSPSLAWENLYQAAGPEGILLVGFANEALKPLTGKSLAEVAKMRGKTPIQTAIDLIIEDDANTDAVYFMMSEENVRREIALPYMSFGSDAGSMAAEGVFLKSSTHPRAYGNFARLLGKYVREEKIIPLEEAIRKLTSQPAENLKVERRGRLKAGYYADLAIFDPAKIADHATYEKPHQYATGMVHVIVNGTQVLKDGEHTGATPGMVVRGPGYKKK